MWCKKSQFNTWKSQLLLNQTFISLGDLLVHTYLISNQLKESDGAFHENVVVYTILQLTDCTTWWLFSSATKHISINKYPSKNKLGYLSPKWIMSTLNNRIPPSYNISIIQKLSPCHCTVQSYQLLGGEIRKPQFARGWERAAMGAAPNGLT